jgi:NAD(P)-dependent dehydrogenase (short-subunit alcohol dehydrogenase family)
MSSQQPVVAITGGSAGLGRALAEQLLRKGMAVAICARRSAPLEEAVRQLSEFGPLEGFVGDVGDPFFRTQWIRNVVHRFGRLDALVNNASILGDLPLPRLVDTSVANLRRVFEVNTFAPVMLLQEALPHLKQAPRAVALSISSDAAVGGYPNWGVYGASKAALDLLTRTFAAETEASTVAFYAVDPGDMQTAMHEAAVPGAQGLPDPIHVARVIAQLFDPLVGAAEFPFPSGSRLQVAGSTLVATGGGLA